MRYGLLLLAALVVGAAVNLPLHADDRAPLKNPVRNDPDAIAAGHRLYRHLCFICHLREGGRGPDLFRNSLTDAQFFNTVMHGRKNTQMPAWHGRLKPEQVWQLQAFVMSRNHY